MRVSRRSGCHRIASDYRGFGHRMDTQTRLMCPRPASPDRRWNTFRSRRQRGIPLARCAGVPKSGSGEFQRQGVRIGALADVLALEHELAELRVPVRGTGADVGARKAVARWVREGEEGRAVVVRITRPPADLNL